MWKIKALALTVQKLLAKLKFSKNGSNSNVKVTVSKIMIPKGRFNHKKILMLNIKALALSFQKLSARLKFQRGGQNDRQPPPPAF